MRRHPTLVSAMDIQSTNDPETIKKTLQYFATYAGVEKPYKLLIDGSAIMQGGNRLDALQLVLQDPRARIYTTECVKKELAVLRKYSFLPECVNLENIEECSCPHEKATFHEDCVEKLIGNYNIHKFVVVTSSNKLVEELLNDNTIKVPIVKLENDGFSLMKLSKNARSLDNLILRDDLIRMKMRANLLCLVEEDTGVGGDSLFDALTCVLNFEDPNDDMRLKIVDRMKTDWRSYLHLFQNNRDTLALYVVNLLHDGTWGDSITLQAASDCFNVKINVLSGCVDQKIMEWEPQDNVSTTRDVFLSYLDGFRYGALHKCQDRTMFILPEEDERVDLLHKRADVPKLYCEGYMNLQGDHSHLLGERSEANFSRISQFVKTRLQTYSFDEVDIIGDGNCVFRCISHNLCDRNQNKYGDVKKKIIKQLKEHPELYREVIYDNYVKNMSQPEAYGDNTVLQACTDAYDCRVVSFGPTPHEVFYDIPPLGLSLKRFSKDIFLSDIGWHNNAVYHTSDMFGI